MVSNCDECGKKLELNNVERPDTDWVKVVCSNCGTVKNVSMVRLSAATQRNE